MEDKASLPTEGEATIIAMGEDTGATTGLSTTGEKKGEMIGGTTDERTGGMIAGTGDKTGGMTEGIGGRIGGTIGGTEGMNEEIDTTIIINMTAGREEEVTITEVMGKEDQTATAKVVN